MSLLNFRLLCDCMLCCVTLAHKTRSKDWEQDDYYDSDEDNFLDRTGDGESN